MFAGITGPWTASAARTSPVEHLGERRVGVARRRRSSRRGCPAGRRRSRARRARGGRTRRSSVLVRVVLPVPPFWERTAIVLAIGRTICRSRQGDRIIAVPSCPSRARSKKARNPGGPIESLLAAPALASAGPAALGRRPRRVCDLRLGPQGRDAEPRARAARAGEPPEDAPPRRQRRRRGRRLRPAGRHPAPDLGRGGARRRPQPGARQRRRRSRSATCSSSAPRTSSGRCTTPASFWAAPACGSSPSASARSSRRRWARPRARRSPTSGSSPACSPSADERDRALLRAGGRARVRARLPRAVALGGDLRLQGHGRAARARRLLPATSRTSASRRRPASATTATRPTPGRRSGACSRSRSSATTVRSTRSSSCGRRRGRSASRSPTAARTRWTSTGRSTTWSGSRASASPRRWS